MELPLPLVWHVVRVLHNLGHEQFWVEHAVILGDHAPCHGQDRREDGDVEEGCSVGRDFEVDKEIRVEDGS